MPWVKGELAICESACPSVRFHLCFPGAVRRKWTMETAAELLRGKGDDVASLPSSATVSQAVQLMNARQIGSVLVIEDERLIGIFTARDLLTRIVAAERHPSVTILSEVMTSHVVCALPHTTVDEMRYVMRHRHIHYLPVINERNLVLGILSIGDLHRIEPDGQIHTIRELNKFMNRQ